MCFMLCAQHVFCVFYVLGEAGMFWSILHCAIVHLCIWQFSYSDFAHFASTFFYCTSGVYIIFERRKLRAHLKSLGKHDFLTNGYPMPHRQNVKNITMAKMLGKVCMLQHFRSHWTTKISNQCWWRRWRWGGYCFCRCRALRQASLWEACMCHNLKMQHSCCTMWSLWKQQNTHQLT